MALALRDMAWDPYARPENFDRVFRESPDPWSYASTPQQERHERAVRLLENCVPGLDDVSALEVGCAEGHFTTALAERCRKVLALDWSDVALERARQRCEGRGNVDFSVCNLRRDPVPGDWDLIVVMDVLETVFRPWVLRRMAEKLIRAVQPRGYLLAGSSRQSPYFETSWWAKPLLRGGVRIHDYLAADPRLNTVRDAGGPFYVLRLLQRR